MTPRARPIHPGRSGSVREDTGRTRDGRRLWPARSSDSAWRFRSALVLRRTRLRQHHMPSRVEALHVVRPRTDVIAARADLDGLAALGARRLLYVASPMNSAPPRPRDRMSGTHP